MKIKLKIFVALVATLFVLTSCRNEMSQDYGTSNQDSPDNAMQIARDFLQTGVAAQANSEWAANAEIISASPMYVEGVKEISYYDCKTVLGGQDAGYIIVNVNNTDVTVPEYSAYGTSITERIFNIPESRSSGAKIYRYGHFRYLVLANNARGEKDVLVDYNYSNWGKTYTGNNINKDNISTERVAFTTQVKKFGSAIEVDRSIVEESNTDYLSNSRDKDDIWGGGSLPGADTWFPNWKFTNVPDDNEINQTAIAFGKVYAYWYKQHGRSRLFEGAGFGSYKNATYDDSVVWRALKVIHDDVGTSSGRSLERKAIKYGNGYNYNFACDVDYSDRWTKGKRAYEHGIAKGRPLVVEIKNGGGFATVIGVDYKYRVRGRKRKRYYRREMWYKLSTPDMDADGPVMMCTYSRFSSEENHNLQGMYRLWELR